MSFVLSTTDAEFASEVLDVSQPVLVYFWASWCGPCRLMAPVAEWAAVTYQDRLKVLKMEIDPNPDTVNRYHIRGVPTLILFREGEVVDSLVGALAKEKVASFLDTHLGA